MAATTSLRFSTILAARSNDGRPTDLEVLLRPHCHKLKVVERLHGRAHLLFPKLHGCTNSLAVRVVDECDFVHPNNDRANIVEEQLFGELQTFMEAYSWTVVLFVLPTRGIDQLDNPKSLFHSTQTWASKLADTNTARVIGVPTPTLALEALFSMIQALSKQSVRQTFWKRQQLKHFVDPSEECRTDAAEHVTQALVRWGERFEVPQGDLQVWMSIGGTLQEMVDRAITPGGLDELPVEKRTKHVMRAFFGAGSQESPPVASSSKSLSEDHNNMAITTEDDPLDVLVPRGGKDDDDIMETGTTVPTYSGGWRIPPYPYFPIASSTTSTTNFYPQQQQQHPPFAPPGMVVQQQHGVNFPTPFYFGVPQASALLPLPRMQPWGSSATPSMMISSVGHAQNSFAHPSARPVMRGNAGNNHIHAPPLFGRGT